MSISRPSRREFLKLTSRGVSAFALSSLVNAAGTASPIPRLHHQPRAKSVIFLYMSGGVSHVDSFDPKPLLKQRHGQPMPVPIERTVFDNNGNIMASPWEIGKYGQSGIEMTNMFPKIAARADDLAVIRSCKADGINLVRPARLYSGWWCPRAAISFEP